MRSMKSVHPAAVATMLAALAASGCADREQELIGKWKASEVGAMFKAIKMKEDTGVSTQAATEAAKVMAATFVEINSDKTFTAGAGGATTEGTWTFNKETGEVVLNITTMKGPDGQVMEQAPSAWTAYMDESDMRLTFLPADPESVAMIKTPKSKAASPAAFRSTGNELSVPAGRFRQRCHGRTSACVRWLVAVH